MERKISINTNGDPAKKGFTSPHQKQRQHRENSPNRPRIHTNNRRNRTLNTTQEDFSKILLWTVKTKNDGLQTNTTQITWGSTHRKPIVSIHLEKV